jgi:hypothetical protein
MDVVKKATTAKAAKAAKVAAAKVAAAAKEEVNEPKQEAAAPQEQKQATHVLYPMDLVQALLVHFTQTPHNMGEVEGIVNGLRKGEQIAR